jgi:hypothetical protein
MAFIFDEKLRNNIGCRITIRIGEAIKDGELPEDEIQQICAYLLVAITDIKTEEEFINFLFILSGRWPFVKEVCEEEKQKILAAINIEKTFTQRGAVTPV